VAATGRIAQFLLARHGVLLRDGAQVSAGKGTIVTPRLA
jgi:hypothetical protein